jgi:methylated-DNA-[protein]-cysteine S-methyltransferase
MKNLYYTYYQSPIGIIKIAATETFIEELSFVDNQEQIEHGEPGVSEVIHQCTEQLIEYFNNKRRVFDLPIHQEGTEFQQKVWKELMKIPFGKTISYIQLATKLGDPKVIRAAASANGKNKIAIIVPCHRVIGSNNTLVGYSGGLWRKKFLVEHEHNLFHGVQTLF